MHVRETTWRQLCKLLIMSLNARFGNTITTITIVCAIVVNFVLRIDRWCDSYVTVYAVLAAGEDSGLIIKQHD